MGLNISVLADRYQIIDLLGEGGSGKTYRALDSQTQLKVAIEVLSLRGVIDWKTVELFEREAKILDQLEHPNIPRYLDYFETIVGEEESFCLVQEIAPGKSLTAWVEGGYIFNETELKQIATQILEILIYLQTFTPPIIHRDLNPNNILRSESGVISLVDFGAVRDTYHLTITGGSTIVGTYGYMAPEQFRGQAVLGTDLYGLGTTLLYLKSGQDPADLPVKQMKIDFRDRVKVSDRFADWLDRLLEPIPEDRYQNATLALDYLDGKAITKSPRPKYPIAHISRHNHNLQIVVPPIWFATYSSKQALIYTIFAILLLTLGYWFTQSTEIPWWLWMFFLSIAIFTIRETRFIKETLLFTIFSIFPIVFLHMWVLISFIPMLIFTIPIFHILWRYCTVIMCQREIDIIDFSTDSIESNPRFTEQQVIFTTKIAGMSIFSRAVLVEDVRNINCRQVGMLSIKGGIRFNICQSPYNTLENYAFGKYLDPVEQHWLMGEISEHLQYLDPRTDRLEAISLSSALK